MGYACPVCAVPQRDGEHLANHLAFTAMLHGDAHADWLDEHAPDWTEASPTSLAETVKPHAEPAEYEEVFEDTVHRHDHGGGRADRRSGGDRPDVSVDSAAVRRRGEGPMDAETEAALREARDLTREMLTVDAGDTDRDGDADLDGDPEGDGDAEQTGDPEREGSDGASSTDDGKG